MKNAFRIVGANTVFTGIQYVYKSSLQPCRCNRILSE